MNTQTNANNTNNRPVQEVLVLAISAEEKMLYARTWFEKGMCFQEWSDLLNELNGLKGKKQVDKIST